jgi:hypothetical protein
MPRCIIECTIPVTARLQNCGDSSVQIIYDMFNYVLNFICFSHKILSIIYWDIHGFRSPDPHKVGPQNDHSANQWNGKGGFSKNTNNIIASTPQQRIKI